MATTEQPPRLDENLPVESTQGSGEPATDEGKGSSEAGTGKPLLTRETWTNAQSLIFFEEVQRHGRNFDRIFARLTTKTRAQIRHYYYRIVRKVRSLLASRGIILDSKCESERRAIMCYWELRKRLTRSNDGESVVKDDKLHRMFPKLLDRLYSTGAVSFRRDKKPVSVRLSIPQPPAAPNDESSRAAWREALNHPEVVAIAVDDEPFVLRLLERLTTLRPAPPPAVVAQIQTLAKQVCGPSDDPDRRRKARAGDGESGAGSVQPSSGATTSGTTTPPAPGSSAATALQVTGGNAGAVARAQSAPVSTPGPDITASSPSNPPKLKCQLFPRNTAVSGMVTSWRCNPQLQLNVPATKPLNGLLSFLRSKWAGSCSGAEAQLNGLRLYPGGESCKDHPGWGWDCDTSIDELIVARRSPGIVDLEYGWPLPQPARELPVLVPTVMMSPSQPSTYAPPYASPSPLPAVRALSHSPSTAQSPMSQAAMHQQPYGFYPPQPTNAHAAYHLPSSHASPLSPSVPALPALSPAGTPAFSTPQFSFVSSTLAHSAAYPAAPVPLVTTTSPAMLGPRHQHDLYSQQHQFHQPQHGNHQSGLPHFQVSVHAQPQPHYHGPPQQQHNSTPNSQHNSAQRGAVESAPALGITLSEWPLPPPRTTSSVILNESIAPLTTRDLWPENELPLPLEGPVIVESPAQGPSELSLLFRAFTDDAAAAAVSAADQGPVTPGQGARVDFSGLFRKI